MEDEKKNKSEDEDEENDDGDAEELRRLKNMEKQIEYHYENYEETSIAEQKRKKKLEKRQKLMKNLEETAQDTKWNKFNEFQKRRKKDVNGSGEEGDSENTDDEIEDLIKERENSEKSLNPSGLSNISQQWFKKELVDSKEGEFSNLAQMQFQNPLKDKISSIMMNDEFEDKRPNKKKKLNEGIVKQNEKQSDEEFNEYIPEEKKEPISDRKKRQLKLKKQRERIEAKHTKGGFIEVPKENLNISGNSIDIPIE